MTVVTDKDACAPLQENDAARRRRRVDAFQPTCRRFVADLTRCSPALEDLCDSFPALLFALATGYATPARRERTFELILAGAPLREAADVLGVPWWLRKLPPQAFMAPLPRLPAEPEFTFRITGMIPREPRLTPTWLMRVTHAVEACGPDYALWLARQSELAAPPEEFFMYLAAWAWFGERAGPPGQPAAAPTLAWRDEFQARARGARRMAPAPAVAGMPGVRHRDAVARGWSGMRLQLRGAAHRRRLRRREPGLGKLPGSVRRPHARRGQRHLLGAQGSRAGSPAWR